MTTSTSPGSWTRGSPAGSAGCRPPTAPARTLELGATLFQPPRQFGEGFTGAAPGVVVTGS
ncbi:hypothetical protein [Kineococcus sp. SYSU DK001]|uniref:hypothetical protein n=1 Tax=Kineococcus sp. SYSU DK001 TaxID=3383122 RepID=UPI003D7E4EA4